MSRVTRSHLKDLISDFTTLLQSFMNNNVYNINYSYSIIEFEHHQIHEGRYFTAEVVETLGASLSLSFKTGSKEIHIIINYTTESKAHIEYKEGVTITATTGTEKALINRKRDSSNNSTLLQNKSGSYVADNKILVGATVGGGSVIVTHYNWGDKKTGAVRRGVGEYVLKKNTVYSFLLSSDDGDKGLHLDLNLYELD